MSQKQIPEPRPLPEFHGDFRQYATDLERYIREHLDDIHRELDNLHTVKADA